MKKSKQTKKDIKERQVTFKSYLIRHDTNQRKIAKELGISATAIARSIERGAFVSGPFAKWWRQNVENTDQASA